MGTLRLLVADDHDVVRKGVRTLLEEQPGWEVAAEASDGREADQEKAKLVQPDVTILDLSMPELNGLEAAREILKTVSTKVLILTMYDSDPLIRQTLEAGARGYLLKSRMRGETWFRRSMHCAATRRSSRRRLRRWSSRDTLGARRKRMKTTTAAKMDCA